MHNFFSSFKNFGLFQEYTNMNLQFKRYIHCYKIVNIFIIMLKIVAIHSVICLHYKHKLLQNNSPKTYTKQETLSWNSTTTNKTDISVVKAATHHFHSDSSMKKCIYGIQLRRKPSKKMSLT